MRILIASKLHGGALARLETSHDVVASVTPPPPELERLIADREVVIFRSGVELTAELMHLAPQLRLLIRAGSGVDNIPHDYLQRRGIELHRVPGPGARSVAELAFALMLGLARKLLPADASMRAGRWLKTEMEGTALAGKVLGIVGLGNIGSTVARLGRAWEMEVVGCVEHPSERRRSEFAQAGIRLTDMDEVLSDADFVSIHVPRKPDSLGLIDARALGLMKPSAFLVNLSRGGVVDEQALRAALERGSLAGAALDVHEREQEGVRSPLADLPNAILTPHVGASTVDAQAEIGRRVVEIVNTHATMNQSRLTA